MPIDRLVVVIPGLRKPVTAARSPTASPIAQRSQSAAPGLARLLAATAAPEREPDGIDAALARVYGLPRQRDWPLAPLLASSSGIDTSSDYWLVADPVTLAVGRSAITLAGVVSDLAANDADAFRATLNAHFAADGLSFVAQRPARWFARTATIPAIVTRPVSAALGQPLRALLPQGPDAGQWRRWQDEMQMLLHEHPVNIAREKRGEPPVNGVWLWGGGTQSPAHTASICTYAYGETATALAAYVGSPAKALPDHLDAVLGNGRHADTLVIALEFAPDLDAIDKAWTAPAWRALVRGAATSVILVTDDDDGGATLWTATQPSAWQRLASRFRSPDLAASLARANA